VKEQSGGIVGSRSPKSAPDLRRHSDRSAPGKALEGRVLAKAQYMGRYAQAWNA